MHCARIRIALVRAEALSVKSTGCDGLGTVNVAVTGVKVPGRNAGIDTLAFVALTTVNPCSPMNELVLASTVTDPEPAKTASNALRLPGVTSVIVSDGVHKCRDGLVVDPVPQDALDLSSDALLEEPKQGPEGWYERFEAEKRIATLVKG